MTSYEIVNEQQEVVAVVMKFPNGRCLVQYTQTVFESVEDVGKHFNDHTFHLEES